MSYSARHQHDNQWVKLPVGGDGVHGSPNSLDDPLMTAREVQPMPQSTPTRGKSQGAGRGPPVGDRPGWGGRRRPRGLYRLLRLLAGHSIFVEQPGGQFANSAQSELVREGPGSLRPLAMLVGEVGHPAMGAIARMIQTGEPAFNLVFGAVWEEHLATEPTPARGSTGSSRSERSCSPTTAGPARRL
jgi:hypothetical protein